MTGVAQRLVISSGRLAAWSFGRLLTWWFLGGLFALVVTTATFTYDDNARGDLRAAQDECQRGYSSDNPFLRGGACGHIDGATLRASQAHALAWANLFVSFLAIPVFLGWLTIRWVAASRGSDSRAGVRAWHPMKLFILWVVAVGATVAAMSALSGSDERLVAVVVAMLFGFPLFDITWDWLSGRERA